MAKENKQLKEHTENIKHKFKEYQQQQQQQSFIRQREYYQRLPKNIKK